MALWGNKDSFTLTGTLAVNNTETTVTGSSTEFTTELKYGDMLTIGGNKYKVVGITDDTELTISPAYSTANVTGQTIAAQNTPNYLIPADGRITYGVDTTEAGAQTTDSGWVRTQTYTDMHGVTRTKREVLVAMSSISGDLEDTVYPDAVITISTQPQNSEANTGDEVTFSVTATALPTSATLTYQWAISPDGENFSDVSDAGVYSGSNTATLTISDNTGLDGNTFHVTVSSTGGSDVVSDDVTLTEV